MTIITIVIDVHLGGLGNDYLDGGTGADQLYGSLGDDTLIIDAADTVISGGTGYDTADLRNITAGPMMIRCMVVLVTTASLAEQVMIRFRAMAAMMSWAAETAMTI